MGHSYAKNKVSDVVDLLITDKKTTPFEMVELVIYMRGLCMVLAEEDEIRNALDEKFKGDVGWPII